MFFWMLSLNFMNSKLFGWSGLWASELLIFLILFSRSLVSLEKYVSIKSKNNTKNIQNKQYIQKAIQTSRTILVFLWFSYLESHWVYMWGQGRHTKKADGFWRSRRDAANGYHSGPIEPSIGTTKQNWPRISKTHLEKTDVNPLCCGI